MKKLLITAIILAGAIAIAQSRPAPAQSPSGTAPGTHAEMTPEMRQRMMDMREDRMQQMQQQMREMQPAMDAMRRKVSMLGSELLSVQDVNTRRALQTDMELWQQLLETMQRHMQSMGAQEHTMPHGQAPGMQQTPPAAPKSPQSPQPQLPQPQN